MNTLPRFRLIILIIVACIILTCKKEEEKPREYPRLNTLEVTNISEKGAIFRADVFYKGNEEIIDHGFVWGVNEWLSFENNDRISLSNFEGLGQFESTIKTTLESKKKYFVRAFLKTTNHIVYGKVVSFISLGSEGPIISGFEPKTVVWGDTVIIRGKNFSFVNNSNKIFFGVIYCTPIKSNDTILKVAIPNQVGQSKNTVAVEIAGNKSPYAKDILNLVLPSITGVAPSFITWGDTITLTGYFPKYKNFSYTLKLNNTNVNILDLTTTYIKFAVPTNLTTINSSITISLNVITLSAPYTVKLKAPIIKEFSPSEGFSNQIITIKGKYFKLGNTTVKIGNTAAAIQKVINDSIITVYMPSFSTESNYTISVSTLGQVSQASLPISFKIPKITKVEPYDVTFNDTLSIYGNFFSSNPNNNSVLINAYCCTGEKIVYASPNLIKIIIPASLYYSNPYIRVTSPLGVVEKSNAFKIKAPIINSISKLQGRYGDTITITGKCFNPDKNRGYISVGGVSNKIINATTERVDFILENLTSGTKSVTYSFCSLSTIITENFNYISPYKIKSGSNYISAGGYSFSIDGYGYAGGGYFGNYLSKYNSFNNQWEKGIIKLVDYTDYYGPGYFSINNKGYIIGGSFSNWSSPGSLTNKVFEFDPTSNSVLTKNSFPGPLRFGSFSFSVNGKGFIGGGENNGNALGDFWEYDPINDNWTQKPNFPGGANKGSSSFVVNNKAFILIGTELWSYDQLTDTWERKNDFPGTGRYLFSSFAIGNKGYIANGSPYFGYYLMTPTTFYTDLWEYNTETDLWSKKTPYPGRPCFGCACFVINNKAYIGLGIRDTGYGSIYNDQFYEYDPTLEP